MIVQIKADVKLWVGKDGYTENAEVFITGDDIRRLAERIAKKEYQCDECQTKNVSVSLTA